MTDRISFTLRARRVLELAKEEAHRLNHNYIGTEHILLGLIREVDGLAAKVLTNLGVKLSNVRSDVEFIIGRGDRYVMGEIGLTPRAKKVIELALDEARRLSHSHLGTDHLLLGLIREGEGIAAGVLERFGVNLERVRAEVNKVLNFSEQRTEAAPTGPINVQEQIRFVVGSLTERFKRTEIETIIAGLRKAIQPYGPEDSYF